MTAEAKENLNLSPEEEAEESVAGGIPGEIGATLSRHLGNFVYPSKLGRVFNAQTDFELAGVGKRQPDVGFVSLPRLPVNVFDSVPLAPDLAVEVVSKTDKVYDVDVKVGEYLKAGVRLVWVIYPVRQEVEVYRYGHHSRILDMRDELDGEDVIPGFRLKVSAVFEQ